MAVSDWLRSLTKKSASGGLTASGTGVKVTGGGYQGGSNPMTNTALPLSAQLQYAQPLSTLDANGNETGNYQGYNGGVLGTSTYSTSGGTADPEAQAREAAKSELQQKFGTLQSVFNSLFGSLDQNATRETQKLYDQAGRQQDDLLSGFRKYNDQTNMQFGARGAFDSSYRGQALDEGNQIYERSLGDVGNALSEGIAGVGRNTANAKSGYQNALNSYQKAISQADQYSLADLQQLGSNLDTTVQQGQQAATNYMSDPSAINLLDGVAPIQQQGTAQLAAKLQNLITSSAPIQAKKYIAQGLIKAGTLNDANAQGYWQSYFNDLLAQNGLA